MDYAGRLWTNYSKKPMGERMWAIRRRLIRLASTLPKGSEERRAILAGLRDPTVP
jgi:hypothetical protein